VVVNVEYLFIGEKKTIRIHLFPSLAENRPAGGIAGLLQR
jgi:hypothetical protein